MWILLASACAKPAAPTAPAPSAAVAPTSGGEPFAPLADGTAPRPFTAEQIRAAMPVGTEIHLRMEAPPEAPVEQRWTVTAATAETCTIASRVVDPASGATVADEGEGTSAWAELVEHAAFPAAATRIEHGTISVPAGTFEIVRYTVAGDDGHTRVYSFAVALPGPPVSLVETDAAGATVHAMTLLSRASP